MVWSKLASLFKRADKQDKARAKGIVANTKQQKRRVDPSRIGELGEYKIDVQLRQMPKEIRYVSDVLVRNPRSRTGYSQIDHVVVSDHE